MCKKIRAIYCEPYNGLLATVSVRHISSDTVEYTQTDIILHICMSILLYVQHSLGNNQVQQYPYARSTEPISAKCSYVDIVVNRVLSTPLSVIRHYCIRELLFLNIFFVHYISITESTALIWIIIQNSKFLITCANVLHKLKK